MTILLMVQGPGDWRPRCDKRGAEAKNTLLHHYFNERGIPWWLVEAENADAARRVIECQHPGKQCAYHCGDHARILASGGAAQGEGK